MAAYLVKILQCTAGIGIVGSGTLVYSSWHAAYELREENTRLKSENTKYYLENIHLCQELVYKKEEAEKQKKEFENQLKQNTWTTKLVGAGIMGATAAGGIVGYAMRPMH